ncbi:MAG: alpha/beta fold hydrolase [Gammaproteobacteria bacterium]
MNPEMFRLTARDQLSLQGYAWVPADTHSVKGAVWIIHGFGEYAGRYQHVAERLNAAGYAVFAHDHRGHGLSDGRRGVAPNYDQFLQDINSVRQQICVLPQYTLLSDEAKNRQFMWAHSFGGGLGLNYLLRRYGERVALPPLRGYIISSPWLKLANPPNALKVGAAYLIHLVYPQFVTNASIDSTQISSDPEVQRRYKEEVNDPEGLLHGKISYTLLAGANSAGCYALSSAGSVKSIGVPVRLIHGGRDQVTSAEASRAFAEKANTGCSPDHLAVEFDWRAGLLHETHNEIGRDAIIQDHIQWLDKQGMTAQSKTNLTSTSSSRLVVDG